MNYSLNYNEITDGIYIYKSNIQFGAYISSGIGKLFEFFIGITRKIEYNSLTYKVLKEALLNSLANADFNIKDSVIVTLGDDKLEISNSRSFRVPKYSNKSDPRNFIIMNILKELVRMESESGDIEFIESITAKYGWVAEYKERFFPNYVTLLITPNP